MNLNKLFHLKENHNGRLKPKSWQGYHYLYDHGHNILAVNPYILEASGMDRGAVFTATALSSFIATLPGWHCFPIIRSSLHREWA